MVEVRTVLPGQKDNWDWVEGFFSLDWLFEGHLRGTSVSYAISAPRRMDTELLSTNGGVQVGAMEGQAELRTTNGTLKAEGMRGELKGRTTNGAITLSGLAGGCDVGTTNGRITAEFLALGGQGCDLRTTNGTIRVTLPENARADLDAATTNGAITSELPLSMLGESNKRRMEGKINGGGPPLRLRTTNGNIAIGKGLAVAGLPAPALPPARPGLPAAPDSGKESRWRAYFMRIQFWEGGEQKVKVIVPLALARGALRSLPDEAQEDIREKGIDIDTLAGDILHNPKIGKVVEILDEDSQVKIDLLEE
jgi:hypothetical protein